jgi:hypothetical protein
MSVPVSDSVVHAAEDEALAIAGGLARAEVEQRARQAFQSANDIRARCRGLPDAGKRAAAASRARTWVEILRHMDATGEPEFCGRLSGDIPPAFVRAVWAAWECLARVTLWLNVPAVVRAFRDVFGVRAITFYQWPEAGQDASQARREHPLDTVRYQFGPRGECLHFCRAGVLAGGSAPVTHARSRGGQRLTTTSRSAQRWPC